MNKREKLLEAVAGTPREKRDAEFWRRISEETEIALPEIYTIIRIYPNDFGYADQ